ncbi:MAG: DNA translocase FtsK [Cytophagaceae bacterium]|nr:DNA translocase FtsK [Cytophagaceae bacterium]
MKNVSRQIPDKPGKKAPIREPRPPRQLSLPFRHWGTALRSPQARLAAGVLTMLLAIGLALAFTSYLISGQADQSVVGSAFHTRLRESGDEVRNWLGLSGALIAHLLVFRWFGVAAFLLVPVLFATGFQMAFRRALTNLQRLTLQSLFYLFWGSAVLGYVVLVTGSETSFSALCGGIGYEINVFLYNLLGWASIGLIVFALFLFAVYFYGVTSLDGLLERFDREPQPAGEDVGYEPDFDEKNTNRPRMESRMATVESLDDETDLDEDVLTNARLSSLAAEAAASLNGNGTNGHQNGVAGPDVTPASTARPVLVVPELVLQTAPPPTPEPAPDDDEEGANEELLRNFGLYDPTLDLANYQYPPLDLLREYANDKAQSQVSQDELEANKDRIVKTLGDYGIGITQIMATIGPTVTLYEIIPNAGVKISKIKNLEDDIALSLAALGIRIIAPIPGKGTIGIEVPNKNREMVSIRSLLASEKFQKSNADLPVVLGKTISNEIFLTDLAKMPHLLMAGATGQGKSVGLNVMLASLIYKKHPAQLKFVLVDPKKVELTLFNKIERHFLAKLPDGEEAIITDTKKVVNTLNSLCIEMDNRYNLLKDAGCRNIKEYNTKFVQRRLNPDRGHRFMPYIVLVIDELADLMMTAGKEVETPIARLAQLARAIGIHLVVATQRPSVNVITGIIKANFPARLSFKVTSKIDSRTILDTGGAEQLVGMGDMLLSNGSDLIRLQCAFVDTKEVEDVCEFIGEQRGYDSAYLLPEYAGDEGGEERSDFDPANLDPMFKEAAKLVVMHQQGSTSLIQRRLKLGYNRAGRLIDQLESAGVVGPFEGSKAREVLVHDEAALDVLLRDMG